MGAIYGASASGLSATAALGVGASVFWPAAAVGGVTSIIAVPLSRWSWNDSYRRGWNDGIRQVYKERIDQCWRKYMWELRRSTT